jgi:hypothetical protein
VKIFPCDATLHKARPGIASGRRISHSLYPKRSMHQ